MARGLIDTCKGKGASATHNHGVQPSLSSSPLRRPSTQLGCMVSPAHIPKRQFDTVQRALNKQDRIITLRNNEIQDLIDENQRLHRHLARARQDVIIYREALERREESLRQERAAYALRDEEIKQADELLRYGSKVMGEKAQQVEALTRQLHALKRSISAKDKTIAGLHSRLKRLSTTTSDDRTTVLLEEQAHRTLGLVQGLKNDVADRDAKLQEYEIKLQQLMQEQEAAKGRADEARASFQALQDNYLQTSKKCIDSQSVLDEQAALINKLLQENARLVFEG